MYPLHVAALPEEATLDNPSETPFVLDPADYQAHQALMLCIVKSFAAYPRRGLPEKDNHEWMVVNALQLTNEIFKEYVAMHDARPKPWKNNLHEEIYEYDLAVYLQHRKLTLQLIAQHIHGNFSVNTFMTVTIAEMVNYYSRLAHKTLSAHSKAFPLPEDGIPNVDF